jgi:glucose/mannose-6-phosphate isomerase
MNLKTRLEASNKIMEALIHQFPNQLEVDFSKQIFPKSKIHLQNIHNVCIAGMGGSGIGSDFVQLFAKASCRVPIISIKTREIPGFIDEHTLFIASSYSGNTAETLSSLKMAIQQNAIIVCVTSGGELMNISETMGFPMFKLPTGIPAPRAALAYSLIAQLEILIRFNLVNTRVLERIRECAQQLKKTEQEIMDVAANIAQVLQDKIPVIYSGDQYGPSVLRLRQQINENAKTLCWHKLLPEMNHNEIVGWTNSGTSEHPETSQRLDLTSSLLQEKAETIMNVLVVGDDIIEQSLYLSFLSDWISYYIAISKGVDMMEIKMIDRIKSALK